MGIEKPTRYRRTKADITEDIRKAAVDQVMKRGFSLSLVTEIIKKAKIEPPVFYHRYKDLDEFYSEFVKGYDYWFSDIADKAMKSSDNPKLQFTALMEGLQEALKDKSVMQELLRWEIAEGNDTTKRTATLREMFTLPLAEKYKALFKDTCIDFVALTVEKMAEFAAESAQRTLFLLFHRFDQGGGYRPYPQSHWQLLGNHVLLS